MKRVGIYGGSFAPPHKGHLKSALSFYDECALDELYILPAGEPPHKTLQGNAGPEERFFMTELTFSKENCGARRIFVSDYELKKAGKSYSFETAEHFAAPGTELFLAVGSDMFLSFESWKHPEILLRLCTLVLNRREKTCRSRPLRNKNADWRICTAPAFSFRTLCPSGPPPRKSENF